MVSGHSRGVERGRRERGRTAPSGDDVRIVHVVAHERVDGVLGLGCEAGEVQGDLGAACYVAGARERDIGGGLSAWRFEMASRSQARGEVHRR